MNIVSAYLADELKDKIYMKISEGLSYTENENKSNRKTCQLIKSLYSLKQSEKVWNNTFQITLKSLEFMKLSEDNSVFLNWISEVIITLYVDDLLIFVKELRAVLNIKKELKNIYEIKNLREADVCLSIQIQQNQKNWTLTIDQHTYIERVLKDFTMKDSKSVYTSIDSYKYIKSALKDKSMINQLKYQKAVESLTYTMTVTCSDLTFAIGKISQFNHRPFIQNQAEIQWIFWYLKGSKNMKITYSEVSHRGVFEYSDSDYTEDSVNRKFTHEYVFTLAERVISWFSQKQKITATSITEAEYVRLCSAVKTAVWITEWLKEVKLTQFLNNKSVQLYEDNQSSIKLIKNLKFHTQTKHIDVQYHYVQKALQNSLIELLYISTNDMSVNCSTKLLTREKLQFRLSLLRLINQ